MVPLKGTFEVAIQHRFGTVGNGWEDMAGIFAPANIRLGFNYVPINDLMLGFGLCKNNRVWDANLKYAIIKQSKEGGWPVSITYYGNMAADLRPMEGTFAINEDRLSYFHQLMIARKVTSKLSLQVSVSLSHFNNVAGYFNAEGDISPRMMNDHIAIALMGRYKITEKFALIGNYDQPLTDHPTDNPSPSLSGGIEMGTSGHSFQLFVTNYQNIVPQYNNMFNQNNFQKLQSYLIGFNITRKWNFSK